MNADLRAQLIDAARQLQNLTVEPLTIAGVEYSATAADMIHGSIEFYQGGAADMQNISVCVLQDDLPAAPAVNTPALFRGVSFRVKSVDNADTFWQLSLVQEFA